MASPLWEQLNAKVTKRVDVSPGLSIIRVEPDGELFEFAGGQYCVLGLPPDAKRVPEAEEEESFDEKKAKKMVRRAYSIASSSKENEYLEFYVALVTTGEFTPRLFALEVGDRIWLGPKATGLFTLKEVPEDADLFLVGTGTGLAPYISMLRGELIDEPHDRQIVIAHGARYAADLGYRAELEGLARIHDRLTYIPSITRPGDDGTWKGESGYLQQQIESGRLEELSGVKLDPATSHVFLCGNPAMIEAAVESMEARGFTEWSRKNPEGQIHLERYW
jgi:ferredoxin--NADP+ reductase